MADQDPFWILGEILDSQLTNALGESFLDGSDGPGDALRHAMANAYYMRKYGEIPTRSAAYINEVMGGGMFGSSPNENPIGREMDFHNNDTGREVGMMTTSPEEALMVFLDMMDRSANQRSKFPYGLPWPGQTNQIDTSVPLVWNRQHYTEKPDEVRTKIQDMQDMLDEGTLKYILDEYRDAWE